MLVIDEAYGELGPESALTPIDVTRPNVVWMRTFSKAYGLAGIRCGYAAANESFIGDVKKCATTTASTAWRWSPARRRSPTRPISAR